MAKNQKGDPEEFIANRLDRAIGQSGHWASKNTMPGLDETAKKLRNEITNADGEIVNINARWVQVNLSLVSGLHQARHRHKEMSPWVKPEPKKAELASNTRVQTIKHFIIKSVRKRQRKRT